jgi:hypothetical protein
MLSDNIFILKSFRFLVFRIKVAKYVWIHRVNFTDLSLLVLFPTEILNIQKKEVFFN